MADLNEDSVDAKGATSAETDKLFTHIVSELRKIDRDSQARFIVTVATYLDLPLGVSVSGITKTSTRIAASQGSAQSTNIEGASFTENRSPSPKEFIIEKKPVTDVERIACLAYYLTHYLDTPHFKTLDLSKLNTEAAQLKFSNPAQTVDNANKSGLLVPATKGQKQISAIGELYVQALPDRAAAREAIAYAKPRRQKSRSKKNA